LRTDRIEPKYRRWSGVTPNSGKAPRFIEARELPDLPLGFGLQTAVS